MMPQSTMRMGIRKNQATGTVCDSLAMTMAPEQNKQNSVFMRASLADFVLVNQKKAIISKAEARTPKRSTMSLNFSGAFVKKSSARIAKKKMRPFRKVLISCHMCSLRLDSVLMWEMGSMPKSSAVLMEVVTGSSL